MDLPSLIATLSQPAAYPCRVSDIDVRQTHISVVFLTVDFAYKLKKPVRLSFLDFSTLDQRRHFCLEEVRLNRRLAPHVYLGVVPVARAGSNVAFEGTGEIIDWAVKMQRLPESSTLEHYVLNDAIHPEDIRRLAVRLARFHEQADRSDRISEFGRFDAIAKIIRDNFTVSEPMVGKTISSRVRRRLMDLTDAELAKTEPLIEARAAQGIPCDTHGDLHLDHVYLFRDQSPPADLVVVDCIEFNERFRYSDPIADVAFLAMDLDFHGRRDLSAEFLESYFEAAADSEGQRLVPLYVSYRAAVRGKVDGLQLGESEIPQSAREQALARARGHWLMALNSLETPEKRAALVLVGGLPGSGKSTLAANLARRADFQVIRSDVVRKELAGVASTESGGSPIGEGLYTEEMTERTYAECLRRAGALLFDGERVIVDATFVDETRRRRFYDLSISWGVSPQLLWCQTNPETIQKRLTARRGDASDADWAVYLHSAERLQHFQKWEQRWKCTLDTSGSVEEACQQALARLREAGLWTC
jgi:aminoglycoside phosphotransferase family enzyme/predicted kinase